MCLQRIANSCWVFGKQASIYILFKLNSIVRGRRKFSIRSARCFRNVLNFVLVLHVSWKVYFRWEDRTFYWPIYDSCWQDQMSVRALRHDKRCGWFSKSRGLSASVSFLSSPPPPRLLAPFFARPLLRNSTETLATQATAITALNPRYVPGVGGPGFQLTDA